MTAIKHFLRRHRAIVVIATLYVALSCLYNLTVPLWEAPDEVGHFHYAVTIRQEGRLPRMEAYTENHQPPLYYLWGALWLLPADLSDPTGALNPNPDFVHLGTGGRQVNISLHSPEERQFPYRGQAMALHLLRLASSLLGLGTVLLTYALGNLLFPQRETIAGLAAALVAFNPQYLFIHASANNDALLTLTTTALLWYVARLTRRADRPSLRQAATLGLLTASVLLTKLTGVLILAYSWGVVALITARRASRREWMQFWGLAVAVTLAVSGWWWGRNWLLYGDPLGWHAYRQLFAAHLRHAPLTPDEWRDFARTHFRSFWGLFGWMNVFAPSWFYRFFAGLMLLAVGGLVPTLFRRKALRLPAALLAGALLAQMVGIVLLIRRGNASLWQGRYLFPAIAPLSLLLSLGLGGWMKQRLARYTLPLLGGILLSVAAYTPGQIIAPAYRPARTAASPEHPLDVTFGDLFHLRGYTLTQDALAVKVTLYWEAMRRPDFDYSVFVHLLTPSGELIGQQDHAPGSDRNYPPTAWRAGETIADVHRISLLRAPQGPLLMRIGVYNWATGDRLPTGDGADALELRVSGSSRWPGLLLPVAVALVVGAILTLRRHRRCEE